MNRGASAIIAAPMGTLTKNPARQEIQWASAPPITSPKLAPIPAVAPYKATARVRSLPSGKLAVSRDREAGATIAAPIPCTARPAIAHQPAGATPISSDAIENTTSPTTKTRRRPSKSPARAPRSSRPPKTSVYASWTQESSPVLSRSSACRRGRAVKMTELSRRIMK
ncbi:hypothetical protein GCM10023346_34560 [Arthrobacter gyeryongensis]|uniref:Uncharacterized protein n=1 Tax=Arthrobacter gyeryongensis TaxID=1650592 RepID=A0ABP9SP28_9MICC